MNQGTTFGYKQTGRLWYLLGSGWLMACISASGSHTTLVIQQHCQACYVLPTPELLDKTTWIQIVLPRMGQMLGHFPDDSVQAITQEAGLADKGVRATGLLPAQPRLSAAEWDQIAHYFQEQAPTSLPQSASDSLSLPGYQVRKSLIRLSPPSTTLVQIREKGGFFLGDVNRQKLYQFGPDHTQRIPLAFLFRQTGPQGHKEAGSFPAVAQLGRWMVPDVGDLDLDGDTDILQEALTPEVPDAPDGRSDGSPWAFLLFF